MLVDDFNLRTILMDGFPNQIHLSSQYKLKRFKYKKMNFVCYMTDITGTKRKHKTNSNDNDNAAETDNLNPHDNAAKNPPRKKRKLNPKTKYVLYEIFTL